MATVHEFIQELQAVISADKTTRCYQRALKYLNDNNYQTVRNIPEEDRDKFIALVKAAADEVHASNP